MYTSSYSTSGIPTLALGLILALLTFSEPARSAELDGAWANDKDACGMMFTRTGGKVSLARNADFYGSGFVIGGNTIRGKTVICKIRSKTQKGDKIHISATCGTDIMLSDTQFDLKIGADGELIRSFPGMPEMTLSYHRCALDR